MSMVEPSIDELMGGKHNRYVVCLATAKCAREITDEYVRQREYAERLLANKETDKSLISMIKKEYRDEKAVKNAIDELYGDEYRIVQSTLPEGMGKGEVCCDEVACEEAVTEEAVTEE